MSNNVLYATGTAVVLALMLGAIWPDSNVRGEAFVIDGDTIRISDRSIRLLGLDAPELGQMCTPFKGEPPFDCGIKARQELRDFISRRTVECSARGTDKYGRTLAICTVEGQDLAQFMIVRGWAITSGDYSYHYTSDERYAKAERAGIWSTFFDHPSLWRARK